MGLQWPMEDDSGGLGVVDGFGLSDSSRLSTEATVGFCPRIFSLDECPGRERWSTIVPNAIGSGSQVDLVHR